MYSSEDHATQLVCLRKHYRSCVMWKPPMVTEVFMPRYVAEILVAYIPINEPDVLFAWIVEPTEIVIDPKAPYLRRLGHTPNWCLAKQLAEMPVIDPTVHLEKVSGQ